MKKRVLVTGAGGLQGGAVVKQLANTTNKIRIFTRTGETKEQFLSKGIEVAQGEYHDSNSLKKALKEVDYVFLTYPVQYDIQKALNYCQAFINAAKDSSIKRIVYNTSAWYPDEESEILLQEIRRQMELTFKASGLPFVILRPTLYLNNFLGDWSLPQLVKHGILTYPVAPNQQLAWTTHELSAMYAISAFKQPDAIGKRYDLGNYLLTGEDIASIFADFLQREVSYHFIEPSVFEGKLTVQAGEHIARCSRQLSLHI